MTDQQQPLDPFALSAPAPQPVDEAMAAPPEPPPSPAPRRASKKGWLIGGIIAAVVLVGAGIGVVLHLNAAANERARLLAEANESAQEAIADLADARATLADQVGVAQALLAEMAASERYPSSDPIIDGEVTEAIYLLADTVRAAEAFPVPFFAADAEFATVYYAEQAKEEARAAIATMRSHKAALGSDKQALRDAYDNFVSFLEAQEALENLLLLGEALDLVRELNGLIDVMEDLVMIAEGLSDAELLETGVDIWLELLAAYEQAADFELDEDDLPGSIAQLEAAVTRLEAVISSITAALESLGALGGQGGAAASPADAELTAFLAGVAWSREDDQRLSLNRVLREDGNSVIMDPSVGGVVADGMFMGQWWVEGGLLHITGWAPNAANLRGTSVWEIEVDGNRVRFTDTANASTSYWYTGS
ncbi:MAG: hypothetical protein FWD83_07420 [Promicromonosporaceae bacterium]|nr:hypothetical protein [Promicromonosporaceae bacterium]